MYCRLHFLNDEQALAGEWWRVDIFVNIVEVSFWWWGGKFLSESPFFFFKGIRQPSLEMIRSLLLTIFVSVLGQSESGD